MSKVAQFPVSAEAMSRLHTLAASVTIDALQRAEVSLGLQFNPPLKSTLIAMYFAPGVTAAERALILRELEPKPSFDFFPAWGEP